MITAFHQLAQRATNAESVQWVASAICNITSGTTQTTKDAFATKEMVKAIAGYGSQRDDARILSDDT